MTAKNVSGIVAAFQGRGRSRSKLYWFLIEHYVELSAAREGSGRIDWVSAAEELNALGIRARGGRSLKPETVRRAWHRVEAEVASGQTKPPSEPKKVPVDAPVTVHPPASQDEDRPTYEPRHRFSGKTPTYRNPFKKDDK